MTNKLVYTMMAGAMALTMSSAPSVSSAAAPEGMEKCYGVVKAGKNGCGDADGKHPCAGQAEVDGSPREWVLTPAGLCDKLANGSTEPYHRDEANHEG